MKAAIYQGKEQVELSALPTPVAGDDDVVIQNLYASICGTDVAVYRHGPGTGHRITVGDEFGHEAISRVAQVGKNVKGFAVGDVVYPYPLLARGDTRRAGTLGAFSEYILVPKAQLNRKLYKLDPRIPVRMGCLIEPFTVGCRAARCSPWDWALPATSCSIPPAWYKAGISHDCQDGSQTMRRPSFICFNCYSPE